MTPRMCIMKGNRVQFESMFTLNYKSSLHYCNRFVITSGGRWEKYLVLATLTKKLNVTLKLFQSKHLIKEHQNIHLKEEWVSMGLWLSDVLFHFLYDVCRYRSSWQRLLTELVNGWHCNSLIFLWKDFYFPLMSFEQCYMKKLYFGPTLQIL